LRERQGVGAHAPAQLGAVRQINQALKTIHDGANANRMVESLLTSIEISRQRGSDVRSSQEVFVQGLSRRALNTRLRQQPPLVAQSRGGSVHREFVEGSSGGGPGGIPQRPGRRRRSDTHQRGGLRGAASSSREPLRIGVQLLGVPLCRLKQE
jgi:hypothetical protein